MSVCISMSEVATTMSLRKGSDMSPPKLRYVARFQDSTSQIIITSPHALHKLFDIVRAVELNRGVAMFAQPLSSWRLS